MLASSSPWLDRGKSFFLSLADNGWDGSRPFWHRPSSSETGGRSVLHRFLCHPCGLRAGSLHRLPAERPVLSPRSHAPSRRLSWRTWQLRIASARLCLANPGHMAPTPICKKEVEKNQSLMEQAHIEAIAALRSRREAFSLASLDSAPSISDQISPSLSGQKIPSLTTTAKRDVAPCFMSMPTSSSAR